VLAFLTVISSIYLWKYPSASRQAYIVISYFLLICFEVVLWVIGLIHYESSRYTRVQTAVRIALHLFFYVPITISIWMSGNKKKSDRSTERDDLLASAIVKSGTTLILLAFLTTIIYWLQARIAPLYDYYPPFNFPLATF
jgi:hypothetical protein